MSFQSQKISQLNRKDKSDKGNWDSKIEKLCKNDYDKIEKFTKRLMKLNLEKRQQLFCKK